MAHIQREALEMQLFHGAISEKPHCNLRKLRNGTLPLVLAVRFSLLNHLNLLVSDYREQVELKNRACMIVK